MDYLLPVEELPSGFMYPSEFMRVVDLGLTNLEPWWILGGELLTDRARGLRQRFPRRSLVPFAKRQDNDDVACWDVARNKVIVVHDFGDPDAGDRGEYENFYSWLRRAIEDLIIFD